MECGRLESVRALGMTAERSAEGQQLVFSWYYPRIRRRSFVCPLSSRLQNGFLRPANGAACIGTQRARVIVYAHVSINASLQGQRQACGAEFLPEVIQEPNPFIFSMCHSMDFRVS